MSTAPEVKRRSDRLSQRKHRNGRRSYLTDMENARILLAWEAAELTEGQAAEALGVDRLGARKMREEAIGSGIALAAAFRTPRKAKP